MLLNTLHECTLNPYTMIREVRTALEYKINTESSALALVQVFLS